MGKRRWLGVGFAVAVAVAVLALFPVMASAAYTNTECLQCHSVAMGTAAQNFNVGAVNFATACRKCHLDTFAGTHPYHNATGNCGAVCHPGWGDSLVANVPSYLSTAGAFASANSLSTPASLLHIIHSKPRWEQAVDTAGSKCGSCHAVASCDACHEAPVDTSHETHASTLTTLTPWVGDTGSGVILGDQTNDTHVASNSIRCGTTACHNTSGVANSTASLLDDSSHPANAQYGYLNNVVTKGPVASYWRTKYASVYTMGQEVQSNYLNATLSLPFTGEQIVLVSDKDPFRGIAEIKIDGVSQGTVDLYSDTTKNQVEVFKSATLAPGAHTMVVRVTNTKNAAARATFVSVDQFKVYTLAPGSVAPACTSCHPANGNAHGIGSFSHEATGTAGNLFATGYGNYTCDSCHAMPMLTEHGRSSSSSFGRGCSNCHTTYAPYVLDTWDTNNGCGFSTCHASGSPRDVHTAMPAAHATTTDPAEAGCRSCHAGDLAVIHADSITTNAFTTTCNTCHTPTKFPTTKSCADASCHTGSGVHSMATHPSPEHNASGADTGVTNTGGFACATCHKLSVSVTTSDTVAEHAKASSLTTVGGPVDCITCHTAGYFPAGWMATPPTSNTCTSCHAAGKAPAPHAAVATKHDYSTVAGNSASCATGSYCHGGSVGNITDVGNLHAASRPGAANCTSCHTSNISVPVKAACSTCHATGSHTAAHVAGAASAECITCHTDQADFGGHASCATCHANAVLTANGTRYLKGTFAPDCVSCHNATVLGTHAYTTPDPNHYVETTHTATPFTAAAQGTGVDGPVPAEGKECATCHSAILKTAHATTSIGAVSCVACHTDTTLGSAAVVAGNWANHRCTDCHDTGAATAHDAYATTHVVSNNGCAGSGSGCHGTETDLAKLHNVGQSGGAVKYSSCSNTDAGDPSGCHVTDNVRPAKAFSSANACGSTSTGCHTEKTISNHGADHGYTAASDHNATAMTGCTNSGAGCHGATTVPGDAVTDFHPQGKIDCMTSKCHTSSTMTPAWKAGGSGAECSRCHDGSFVNAPTTIALNSAFPAGHYGETTHTAGGASTTVSAGGTATATCANCHNGVSTGIDGLYAQHQGTSSGDVTCSGCHNANLSVTAVVTGVWAKTCAECHTTGTLTGFEQHSASAPVANATSSLGCGASGTNCHSTYDVHALHKNAASGCNLSGCHDYSKQGAAPAIAGMSCGSGGGACHATYTGTTHAHAADAAKHQPTTSVQASSTTFAGVACGSCHDIRTSGSSLTTEHALATSAKTGNANVCLNCHNNALSTTAITGNWATKDTTSACSTCHTGALIVHADPNATAHTKTNTGCANSGAGCHPTGDLSQVGTPSTTANIHSTCLRCHDRAGSASWTSAMLTTPGNVKWDPTVTTCGAATGCHTSAYYSTSTKQHRIGQANVVTGDDAKHTTDATYMTSHEDSGTAINICSDCHIGLLASEHATTSIGAVGCTTGGSGGTGCHNTTTGSVAASSAATVKSSWASGSKKCTDCHAAKHNAIGTAHTATSPLGCGATGTNCHTTYDLAALHKNRVGGGGCQLAGCHDAANKSKRPTLKTCGVGGSCHTGYTVNTAFITHTNSQETTNHAPTTTTQQTQTFLGNSCNSCHVVAKADGGLVTEHGLSSSTMTVSPGNVCKNCHNNALSTTAIQNNWPAKDGTAACASCHTGAMVVHSNEATTTHTKTNTGCGNTGVGCHPTNDLSQVGTPSTTANIHSTCLRCHDRAGAASWTVSLLTTPGNVKWSPTSNTCGAATGCHPSTYYSTATQFHRVGQGDVTNGDDATHHTANATSMTSVVTSGTATNTCNDCHLGTLVAEHATTSIGAVGCTTGGSSTKGCHNTTTGTVAAGSAAQVKASWTNDTCADCHTAQHNAIGTVHTATSTQGCGASGAGCHTTYDLVTLHKGTAGGCKFSGCHDTANKSKRPTIKTCGSGGGCHTSYTSTVGHRASTITGDDTTHTATGMASKVDSATYSYGNACSDCHSATLKSAHTTVTATLDSGHTPWTTPFCADCHNSVNIEANSVTTIKTDSWSAKTCDQCHVTNGNGKHTTYTLGAHTATLNAGCTASDAGCHGTADVRTIHNKATAGCTASGSDSKGGTTLGCHAQNKSMPVTLSCGSGGCHSLHTNGNHMASHDVTDTVSLGCLKCHESGAAHSTTTTSAIATHDPLSIGAIVSGKANDGCNICHGGGGWTDVHAIAKTNGTKLQCAGCHNGTVVGLHLYNPYDPNHYYTASHDTTPASTATTSGTTLDYHSASVNYSYTCVTCHSKDLKTEHFKTSSSFASVPGTYADKCIACHELKVDAFVGGWTGGCAGTSNGCHATKHTSEGTKHNASAQVMATPGSSSGYQSAPSTPLAEGFETNSFATNTWTQSNTTRVTITNVAAYRHAGTYGCQIHQTTGTTTRTDYIEKTFDLSGVSGAQLSFWNYTVGLASPDYSRVAYSTDGGTTWTDILVSSATNRAWTQFTGSLPSNSAVLVRFWGSFNSAAEYICYDDIQITGTSNTWANTALPVGSTALQSCGASYLAGAANCHDVTDIANIHSVATTTVASVVYTGCKVCHRDATSIPATSNCQAAGCHAGVNSDTHGTTYHQSSIASGAAGQVFASTGFTGTWCTGCHDDSIDMEHQVLTPYASTGCAVCHKKTTNSLAGAPVAVLAADTSATIHGDKIPANELCTDCHKTVTAVSPHINNVGMAAASGSNLNATPGLQFESTWSGHKTYDTMYGAITGGTTAPNKFPGVTTTITRPTTSSWILNWNGTATTTMAVRCSDCHGTMTGATGPHGAAMAIKMTGTYNNNYSTGGAYLSSAGIQGNPVCVKCHAAANIVSVNAAHNRGDHQGTTAGKCINCHIKVPHGWKRPWLIGYTTDPAPYTALAVTGIRTPPPAAGSWVKGDCYATGTGCTTHSSFTPIWP